MKTCLASALATLVLATAASAQAGGFHTGDVWESNDALAGQGSALTRIDPLTGVTTAMHASPSQNGGGGLAWDGYRHRLLWRASVAEKPGQHTWLVDGAGQVSDTGIPVQLGWFAPTGDGRIYCIENTGGPQYPVWIDAANRHHRVLDAAGLLPYQLPAGTFTSLRGLAYDAGTNALYACSHLDCDGMSHQQIVMGKLALSADGTRVLGPPTCTSMDIGTGFDTPQALAHLPNGSLLVTCVASQQVPAVPLPNLLSYDPATSSFSTYALTGVQDQNDPYILNDGVYSSALGAALILDTFKDHLRVFTQGSSGNGTVITPTGVGVSTVGGSSEAEQLAEISPTACSGAWVPYSLGLAGKGAFVPTLIGQGCPVPGGALTLKIADVVGGASGSLLVGLAPAAIPFKGGIFAVGALTLNLTIGVGGTSGVAGAGTLSLPAALPALPMLSGVSVFLQCGFADAAAVKGVSLTQGLQLEIG